MQKKVKQKVQNRSSVWRLVSEVICDTRMAAKVKGKVYKTAVRPAMMCGLEMVGLTK